MRDLLGVMQVAAVIMGVVRAVLVALVEEEEEGYPKPYVYGLVMACT